MMAQRPARIRFLFLLSVFVLGGCSGLAPGPGRDGNYNPNAGRYSMDHDSPQLEAIDLSRIEPVVPRAVERTRAGNTSPYTVNGRTYHVLDSEAGYRATGHASWYGRKFHGHQTANGEIYDMFQLTAAHRTLPIPSFARVVNLDNGREVVVRINDRGPFHDERIIDLSYAAATLLDYADRGTARVRVEAIVPDGDPVERSRNVATAHAVPEAPGPGRAPLTTDAPGDYLQVGAFSNYEVARELLQRLSVITSWPAFIASDSEHDDRTIHRVRLGPIAPGTDLDGLVERLVEAGLGPPFRVRR